MNYRWFFSLVMAIAVTGTPLFGARVLTGNATDTAQSFDFSISSFVFNPQVTMLFVGAAGGTPGDFTVAVNNRAANNFVGITPPTVTLDNAINQVNPLHNSVVTHMALVGASPMVTTTSDVTSLYVIQNFSDSNAISVLSATELNDATGVLTSGIVGLGSNAIAPITSTSPASILLALVAPNGGAFGAVGSGIATAQLQRVPSASTVKYAITLENAVTGTTGNLAYPLDQTTSNLIINEPLASLTDPVLYFDQYTNVFFGGFQATASNVAGAGARGVLRITSYPKITLEDIAPIGAIGPDSIVGTSTADGTVTIYDIATMLTTTNLEYLVVRGGTSPTGTLSRQIYALPIVNVAGPSFGSLAAKNSLPISAFAHTSPHIFQGRTYIVPATTPDQLFTSTEIPAIVGGGEVPEDVYSMTIKNDAVIVATQGAGEGGVYISQALFDIYGRIVQWTPWTRAAGTVANVFHIAIENETGDFVYSTGNSDVEIYTVLRTTWTNTNMFSAALAEHFKKDAAGIQGFFNYSNQAVISGGSGTEASCCVAVGYNTVSLIQTGKDVDGQLAPVSDVGSPFISKNGTLDGFAPGVRQIVVSGGDLASMGALISAAFVQNDTQAWLVVGGTGGIAVLADDDGSGFDATTGIGNNLANLRSTMKFRKIGNYSNVRKLVPFNHFDSDTVQDLYVLSPNTLHRAPVSQAALAVGGAWSSTELATSASLGTYSSLSDCLISAPLALLATSRGLVRSGNGVDISLAANENEAAWTPVTIPESPGAVTRLFSLSPTAVASDFVRGGNVYALAATISTSQARLYRYVVSVVNDVVTDATVQLFPDYFISQSASQAQAVPSFLINLGNYRNYFFTNGANYYFTRSAYLQEIPFVNIITQPILTGAVGLGLRQSPILRVLEHRSMGQLVTLSPTGSLCAYGDFGLQVSE